MNFCTKFSVRFMQRNSLHVSKLYTTTKNDFTVSWSNEFMVLFTMKLCAKKPTDQRKEWLNAILRTMLWYSRLDVRGSGCPMHTTCSGFKCLNRYKRFQLCFFALWKNRPIYSVWLEKHYLFWNFRFEVLEKICAKFYENKENHEKY